MSEIKKNNSYVIDTIKKVSVDPDKYASEVTTMNNLKMGLIFLYNSVNSIEKEISKKYKCGEYFFWGRNTDLPAHIFDSLPCFFHWFGTSIINYVRLAGLIVGFEEGCISKTDLRCTEGKKKIKNFCTQYVKNIAELSEIHEWRDKVGAHFAITDPRDIGAGGQFFTKEAMIAPYDDRIHELRLEPDIYLFLVKRLDCRFIFYQ